MIWTRILFWCVVIYQRIEALHFENLNVDDILKLAVPTVKSTNAKCKNHSRFYLEELKNLKLWATEMFDASSKFPSGVLHGSAYDFGNFDECIHVKLPSSQEKIVGKYCMAKFHIAPPNFEKEGLVYRFQDTDHFDNATTWEKVLVFANDTSRRSRSEFYLSYCIPSSCEHEDLESSIQEITKKINSFSDFRVTVSVDRLNCQVKNDLTLTTADIIFMSVVLVFVCIALVATLYDWSLNLNSLQKHKLQGTKHDVLMSFSVWNNLKKLSSETENHDGLHCIHGIKVISMFLIIMGHRIMFIIGSPIVNPNFVEEMYGKVETSVLLNGPIIVDTFFNITGFLSCYSMLVIFEKRKKSVNFIFLYLHRFIRLTPVYAVVLGFYCTIFVKLGSGPFWLERIQVEQERCVVNWWTNILYLNNYIQKDQICMFQSWYMTCDFHFFLIAPVIVWLLRKKPNLGVGVLFIIIILSISVVFAIVYLTQENAILLLYMKFLKDPVVNNTFKNIYIPTHMRGTPYFVGMLAGYLKYHLKTKKYKIPRYVVYTGWIICVFVIEITVYTAFIFYIPEKAYDVTMSAIYGSMHHLTWSICISWIILVVSEGNGAWIQQLLCWKPLHILSKITYAAFLCHGAIQLYSVATLRYANYVSIFRVIFNTAGDISLAFLCGLILSMLFEAPILGLEKITLGKAVKVNAENKSDASTVVVPKIKIIHQCG